MGDTTCTAEIHRISFGSNQAEFVRTLPEGIAVIGSPPKGLALAMLYSKAIGHDAPKYGEKRSIVAGGPLLDSPDQLRIAECRIDAGRIKLRVLHTKKADRGGVFRNLPFRPLVELPVTFAPGRYAVEVEWQAVETLPDGKPIGAPLILGPVSFSL